MGKERVLPEELRKMVTFSKRDFTEVMARRYGLTEPQSTYDLLKKIERGELIRIGWGQFAVSEGKRIYRHLYSDAVRQIVNELESHFSSLDFRIFELIQMNEFMNHQIAHNTIIVSVENDLIEYVFDMLWAAHPGKVMLKPAVSTYYRYIQDDIIVINRLPSETPKGFDEYWQSRIETILVDVLVDKFVSGIIPDNEKRAVTEGIYASYSIDEKTMLTYARRKGAVKKLQTALSIYRKAEES